MRYRNWRNYDLTRAAFLMQFCPFPLRSLAPSCGSCSRGSLQNTEAHSSVQAWYGMCFSARDASRKMAPYDSHTVSDPEASH